ncbi:unnamed protein product [Paramecium pentaurelia]|uniref:Uncharacterized protein n=1 Tax=Paramecium pentaurelia TaxID=43138 RepID=A0A8S1Y2T3_9CILI|nr:unnamed protein product [Paramecium pentaurelia]
MQQNNSAIKHLIKPFSFEFPQLEQFSPLFLNNLNQDYIITNLQFIMSLYSLRDIIWTITQELC